MDNMSIKCAISNSPAKRPAIKPAHKISIIGFVCLSLSNDFGNNESLAIASTVICMENISPYMLLKLNVIYKVDGCYVEYTFCCVTNLYKQCVQYNIFFVWAKKKSVSIFYMRTWCISMSFSILLLYLANRTIIPPMAIIQYAVYHDGMLNIWGSCAYSF